MRTDEIMGVLSHHKVGERGGMGKYSFCYWEVFGDFGFAVHGFLLWDLNFMSPLSFFPSESIDEGSWWG